MTRVDQVVRAELRELEPDPDLEAAVARLQAPAKPPHRHCPCHEPAAGYGPTSHLSEDLLLRGYSLGSPPEEVEP